MGGALQGHTRTVRFTRMCGTKHGEGVVWVGCGENVLQQRGAEGMVAMGCPGALLTVKHESLVQIHRHPCQGAGLKAIRGATGHAV